MAKMKREILVVGIIGPAGSGKDEASKALIVSMGFKKLAFGDPIKKFCLDLGWNGKKDVRGRRLLQDLGQALRNYDIDYWVNLWSDSIEEATVSLGNGINTSPTRIVAPDVRFGNEAEKILALGGILLNITNRRISLPDGLSNHESERFDFMDLPHVDIPNDGSINNLKNKVTQIVVNWISDKIVSDSSVISGG